MTDLMAREIFAALKQIQEELKIIGIILDKMANE